jgi:hypothetical protein
MVPNIKEPSTNGSHMGNSVVDIHSHEKEKSIFFSSSPSNIAPNLYAKKNIGGIVIGLLNKEKTTARGKLTLNVIANAADNNVCMGNGINAQNIPIAAPPAEERRCICQRLGSCR